MIELHNIVYEPKVTCKYMLIVPCNKLITNKLYYIIDFKKKQRHIVQIKTRPNCHLKLCQVGSIFIFNSDCLTI